MKLFISHKFCMKNSINLVLLISSICDNTIRVLSKSGLHQMKCVM